MIKRSFAIAALLGAGLTVFNACSSTPAAPPPPVIDTVTNKAVTGGQITGFVDAATGAHVWRAIPFAAPPVGDLRWRAPRPVVAWEGVRESVDHAPWCPQIRSNLDSGSSADAVPLGAIMGQEDCLYLNVHAPADAAGNNLPVMMWIHGGSNTWGRAEQYDPSKLAVQENVIVVVVQYRLGPLGWFAHSAIRNSGETELDRSANFGNLDHIAALEWIKANAAAFGGNAGNVTIFGESAGGHDVVALLASPKAKGLFQKAIIQSGSFESSSLEEAETTHALSGTNTVARLFGDASEQTDIAAKLRNVSVEELFAAYKNSLSEDDQELPRIIQDGVVLPSTPMREAFNSQSTFNAVPIITGTNKDETKLWNIFDERLVKWRFGAIPIARDQKFYNTVSNYPSRMWRANSVDRPAEAMVRGGHSDVWTYRFDWDEGRKYLGADFAQLFGAAHSLEIPFMMGNFQFLGEADKYIFTAQNAPERLALSDTMMRHWANFARSGAPGGDWTKWSSDAANIYLLDSQAGGGTRMVNDKESPARIFDELKADETVTEEQRCIVYFALRWWVDNPEDVVPASCAAYASNLD